MIYTSYFSKLKKIEELNNNDNGEIYIPISICAKAPSWYTGLQYKKLAPKYGFFMEWKQNHDNDFYIKHFKKEVTDTLDVDKVVSDLFLKLPDKCQEYLNLVNDSVEESNCIHIVLLCYEKPSDFCHRHLVADWVNEKLEWEYVKELEV